eukprot:Phypoly_transcript_09971.p1 GENE.Phypoly_transcript_09971~~Phypoly_transcript_09971.p1  ORF type:complete len:400 (+),score=23.66 Phypoly_transcript_09971:94-1293(+)
MSQSGKPEIEFHNIAVPPSTIPYIPDEVWVKIFYYLDDPRHLVGNSRVCKRFHELLLHNDFLWGVAVYFMQLEFRGLDNPPYANIPRDGNYQKVVSYGKAIHSYHVEEERKKPKPKTKTERIFGSSLTAMLLLVGILVLFYGFFILLGLTLDETIHVPSWAFLLFVLFVSFIIMGSSLIMFLRGDMLKPMQHVITCNLATLVGAFTFGFNLMCLSIFSFVYMQTGKVSDAVWVFCGLGYGTVIFLLFVFKCQAEGLQYRYGIAFRLFMSVSFTCFCLGVVMLVYTQLNSRSIDSFGWAFAAWVFSLIVMIFYLYFLALCFGTGYSSPKGFHFCVFGTLESLTGALFFSTAVLCYCNIVLKNGIPWVKLFVPIYLIPVFVTVLCWLYKRSHREERFRYWV